MKLISKILSSVITQSLIAVWVMAGISNGTA